MSTKTSLGASLLAIGIGIIWELPAAGQEDNAQPASSTSSGQSMQDTNMSSMPRMQMPAQEPAQKTSRSPGKQRTISAEPVPSAEMEGMKGRQGMHSAQEMNESAMHGMQEHAKLSRPAQLQHLHFGNMIGVRPRPGGLAESMSGMSPSSMQGMDMSSMQGRKAPPDARSPDYSDSYRYTAMPGLAMADHALIGMLLVDQLEYAYDNHGRSAAFLDGEAWCGKDFNKLWLKAEGEYTQGNLEEMRAEALWNHAITSYWSTQIGVRHDFGTGPGRTWAALGVQGLAPFWLDTEATLYVGEEGRTAARLQFEYEQLITQRLVLQPKLEVNLYGKSDPRRGIGSGLSDTELGMRLRYEFRRELAPYIGAVWRQCYGRSVDFARAEGHPAGDIQFVAGLHVWF